jgi:hypothetical protein
MAATFQNVYTADGLQVPWFVTSGTPDWAGNVTGASPGTERAVTGSPTRHGAQHRG